MITIADVKSHASLEFGQRLEAMSFDKVAELKWVRSSKLPIREIFMLRALKGGQYSPVWGISSGQIPSYYSRTLRRQTTAKNVVMDLVIDPIDTTGVVPPEAFSFISGYDSQLPASQIRLCANQFVPLAIADFDRVQSVPDFCEFFLERSKLKYRRFEFLMYQQHQLAMGFVALLTGNRESGLNSIEQFCAEVSLPFEDKLLSEYLQKALKR
jgi:hypothetical protein